MNKVYEEIIQLAEGMEERMVTCRRDFHKYAESGWFEMRTSSLIARRLTELGYEVLVGEDVCKRDARMGVPSDEELNYILNKFYLERIIYYIKYSGICSVNNVNKVFKNKYNYIVGIGEKEYLSKKYGNFL